MQYDKKYYIWAAEVPENLLEDTFGTADLGDCSETFL